MTQVASKEDELTTSMRALAILLVTGCCWSLVYCLANPTTLPTGSPSGVPIPFPVSSHALLVHPIPPQAALPTPRPFALTDRGVRAAIMRWIAAYDRHDAPAFLAYLSNTNLLYFDCDYTTNRGQYLRDYRAVRAWILGRWARGDHFQLRDIVVKRADPIRVVGLHVYRTSHDAAHRIDRYFKLIFDPVDAHRGLISRAALANNIQCR